MEIAYKILIQLNIVVTMFMVKLHSSSGLFITRQFECPARGGSVGGLLYNWKPAREQCKPHTQMPH